MIRPLILPLVLGGAMSLVFVLPKVGTVADSAISTTLPQELGGWYFKQVPPTDKEVEILAGDTRFSKAECLAWNTGFYRPDGKPDIKQIDLSVVMSGIDINNSIHRPERCMPAQGHLIYDSMTSGITTEKGRTFPARILLSKLTYKDKEGKSAVIHCVSYYFFVGQHEITENHMRRTFIDMRDRLLRGQDQRWAYVTASRPFSETGEFNLPTREMAEKEIRQLLGELADRNIDWPQIASR